MSSIARRTRLLRIAVALLIALSTVGPWSPVTGTHHVLAVDEGVPDHYAALVGGSINVNSPGYSSNDNVQSGALDGCSLHIGGVYELPPGQLTNDGNGGFSFTPEDPGFQGSGRFEYNCFVYLNGVFDHAYTAIVTLYFVNSLTVTANDDEFYVAEGQSLQIEAPGVLDNDLSEIPSTLATGPDAFQGFASIADDGSFTYTPPPTTGDFGFSYTLTNALGTSDTAFAAVHVLGALTLADDQYETSFETPLTIAAPGVLANDPSKDSIFGIVISTLPSNGTASVQGGLGGIKYTPEPDFEGTDSFTYAATDALGRIKTATVTVRVGTPDGVVSLSRTRATVNTLVRFTLTSFVPSLPFQVVWVRANGSTIPLTTGTANGAGGASGSFKVPATVGGASQRVRVIQNGFGIDVPIEVIPRIKVLTDPAQRGQTVNVSLRGYAKGETVRIRWKNGSRFVQLASVKTSSTGSANVNIVVPAFATDGEHTVRGDGTVFRSETKVVTVLGGPSAAEVVEPTATPTPTPTATPAETATPAPSPTATSEATAMPTMEPTAEPSTTPEPTPDPTIAVTPGPTVETSPEATVVATPEITAVTEPMPDQTEEPSVTPEA